jgi:hypothetical protein
MGTGAQPRATGLFRPAGQDTSMLRRPYYRATDE